MSDGTWKPSQRTGRISGGHNPSKGHIDVVNEIGGVYEEHVYLKSLAPNGKELLWEADLLGVQSADEGHGKLPPIIHIECPFCTSPTDRKAISIDYENKRYEIEVLKEPEIKQVIGRDGPMQVTIDRHLHVQEIIECPYCCTKFIIRGGTIQAV